MTENITTSSNNTPIDEVHPDLIETGAIKIIDDKIYLEKDFVVQVLAKYQLEFIPDLIEKINK